MNGTQRTITIVISVVFTMAVSWPLPSWNCGVSDIGATDQNHKNILTQFCSRAYDSSHEFALADVHGLLTMETPVKTDRQYNHYSSLLCNITDVRTSGMRVHAQQISQSVSEREIAVFEQLQGQTLTARPHVSYNDFTLTAYAITPHSTGKRPHTPGFGITYSGTEAQVNRTVAVDPDVIPLGSLIYIDGIGWRLAEDTGSGVKGKHIDVLLSSDEAAYQFGVKRHVKVYVVKSHRP